MINRHLATRVGGRLLFGGSFLFATALPVAGRAVSLPRDAAGNASPLEQVGERTPGGPRHPITAPDLATLQKLHGANQAEIQLGSLAREKGSTKVVREFGRTLVADHTAADRTLDDYLRARGASVEAMGPTSADSALELLASKTGAELDRAFALQVIADHTKAIALIESARIEIPDGQLLDLCDGLLPILRAHKRTAQNIVAASVRS